MIFGVTYAFFWIAAAILFGVIEAVTLGIATIWFSIGALIAFVFAQLGAPFVLQFIIFLLVSAILLYYTRPVFKRILKVGETRTNVDKLIGQTGIVIEKIEPLHGRGQVKVEGQIWSAKSFDRQPIEAQTEVEIVGIEGVKVVVINKYIS